MSEEIKTQSRYINGFVLSIGAVDCEIELMLGEQKQGSIFMSLPVAEELRMALETQLSRYKEDLGGELVGAKEIGERMKKARKGKRNE